MQIYSPILLTLSSQHENTWRSFEVIKKVKPLYLYIHAYNQDTLLKVMDAVDWPCTIEKHISENKDDSPLSWFFNIAPEGIIIQNTYVPDSSFIYFAQAMLERYRAKKEILMISGYNAKGILASKHSYLFSQIGVGGCFASWRRAWESHKDKLSTVFTQGVQDWGHSDLMCIIPKNNIIDFSPGELGPLQPHDITPILFPLEHQILFPIESEYDASFRKELDNNPTP